MATLIELTGDKKIISKLGALKKKDFSKATRAGAKICRSEAERTVPVRTGALKRSIKVRSLKSRKVVGHSVVFAFKGGKAHYGGFLEAGTIRIKPRQFLKRAAKSAEKPALQTTANSIKASIAQVWGK